MQNHNIYIAWKPEYNLGIPVIDEQHKGIVFIINTLYYGMQNGYTKNFLEPINDMLHSYTRIHFQIEESFFEKSDYPDTENHLSLHRELVAKLDEIGRKSVLDGDSRQLMDFLKKWWFHHICESDMQYREFILKGN